MTDDEVRDELIAFDEWALWESGKHRAILRKLAEERRARSEADREATKLANSDLATTEQVIRALRAENERLRAAVVKGMHYLKGRYPIPVKEKEVLAAMQAALDGKENP